MRIEELRVEQQGNLLSVKRKPKQHVPPPDNTSRGDVRQFTAKSRKRLLEKFARLDRFKVNHQKALFITLTYEKLMLDFKRAKRDLKVFCERIRRKFPKAFIVWRMETQRSGSCHFHLIVGNVRFWDVNEAQTAWNDVSGQTARNSLDIEALRSHRGCMYYVSKYVAKTDTTRLRLINRRYLAMFAQLMFMRLRPSERFLMGLSLFHIFSHDLCWVGRFWGVWGKENMPFAARKQSLQVGTPFVYLFAMQSLNSDKTNWWQNWTIFSDDAALLYGRFCNTFGGVYANGGAKVQAKWRRENYREHCRRIYRKNLWQAYLISMDAANGALWEAKKAGLSPDLNVHYEV